MIPTSYIVSPLIGSVIGYVTNALAIKMLFRPHHAKHIFGVHVPFTPGIIPKEKERIAAAVGEVISDNLLNQEVMEQYLLADDMVDKLRSSLNAFVEKQKSNEETLAEFIGHILSEEEQQQILTSVNDNLGDQIQAKLSDTAVGDQVAHLAMDHVIKNLSADNKSDELLDSIKGVPKMLGKGLLRPILSSMQEPAERMLSRNINEIMQKNGKEIVTNLVGTEVNGFMNKTVKALLAGKDEQIAKVEDKIVELYRHLVKEQLHGILKTINISKIVSDRINEMDVAEAEELVLQVMNKELKAIIWLGAGLGFVLGCVNALF